VDERCRTGGAEDGSQPAPDMRSEGLWRRGGGEWRVAVLRRRRVAAAHADAHPHSRRVLVRLVLESSFRASSLHRSSSSSPSGVPLSPRSPPTLLHIRCVMRNARRARETGLRNASPICLAFLTLGGENEKESTQQTPSNSYIIVSYNFPLNNIIVI